MNEQDKDKQELLTDDEIVAALRLIRKSIKSYIEQYSSGEKEKDHQLIELFIGECLDHAHLGRNIENIKAECNNYEKQFKEDIREFRSDIRKLNRSYNYKLNKIRKTCETIEKEHRFLTEGIKLLECANTGKPIK